MCAADGVHVPPSHPSRTRGVACGSRRHHHRARCGNHRRVAPSRSGVHHGGTQLAGLMIGFAAGDHGGPSCCATGVRAGAGASCRGNHHLRRRRREQLCDGTATHHAGGPNRFTAVGGSTLPRSQPCQVHAAA